LKRDPGRGWRYAEKLLDEEDDERLAKMTDEEVFAEIDKEVGPPRGDGPTADELLAKMEARAAKLATAKAAAPAPAPGPTVAQAQAVEPERAQARVRPLWRRPMVAIPSALALAAAVVFAVQAFTKSPVIGPDTLSPDEVRAVALRNEALQACRADQWQQCLDDLDQARTLDPAGEATSQKELRAIAEQGLRDTPPVPSARPRRLSPDDPFRKMPK
jgi:hypothetical protein